MLTYHFYPLSNPVNPRVLMHGSWESWLQRYELISNCMPSSPIFFCACHNESPAALSKCQFLTFCFSKRPRIVSFGLKEEMKGNNGDKKSFFTHIQQDIEIFTFQIKEESHNKRRKTAFSCQQDDFSEGKHCFFRQKTYVFPTQNIRSEDKKHTLQQVRNCIFMQKQVPFMH